MPAYVYIVLGGALVFGVFLILEAIWRFKAAVREHELTVWAPAFQAALWCCLMAGALVALWTASWWAPPALVFPALLIPIKKKVPRLDLKDATKLARVDPGKSSGRQDS